MPFKDGTGPFGIGSFFGIGRGAGRGRMAGNRAGAGPGGCCVCPNCGEKVPHQAGKPCSGANCPKCGTRMIRG